MKWTLAVALMLDALCASAQEITIKSLAFTSLPYYSTTVYQVRPASSNTYCNSTGNGNINANLYSMPGGATVYGTTTTNTATNCTTTYQPAQNQQLTWRIVYNYNLVEGGGYRYELLCTANWRFSKCSYLNPGQSFRATITGSDMVIEGMNGSGKMKQVKYHILAMAPTQTESAKAEMESTKTPPVSVTPKAPSVPEVPPTPPTEMSVQLRPLIATGLQMPEQVTSMVVGDPTLFEATLSKQDPNVVFVKAKTKAAARSYVIATLESGRKVTMKLTSDIGVH